VVELAVNRDRAAALGREAARRREAEARASPAGFVVKNGSKMRSRISGDMPAPVSATVTATYDVSSSVTRAVATVIDPPGGVASRAFATRFITTCSKRSRSTRTRPASPASRRTS
jgi:hypothetical protein